MVKIENKPTWDFGIKKKKFPKLQKSFKVDVAIIGGGITGITSAYLLSKAGKSVALFEKDSLCTGATGVTTAFLTQSLDTNTRELIRIFGKEKTSVALKSHKNAIDLIEKIVN